MGNTCMTVKKTLSIRQNEELNEFYTPYIFDTTIVPEIQPEIPKILTYTVADIIVPQHLTLPQHQTLKNTKSVYELALEEMERQNHKVFQDPEFQTIRLSISKNRKFLAKVPISWKRPIEFLQPGEIKLFDFIGPMDIKQGELGDCYFLGALSALAEIPHYIEKLFRHREYQENGLYGIYLCNNGIFEEILIDDRIPCFENGGPIFSQANGNELWVLLLEKAYAKIYGTYRKIAFGLPGCALKDLTGAPSEYFYLDNEQIDQCWDYIEKNQNLKYILTAISEKNEEGVEIENEGGIISSHCYAILDIQKVVGSDGVPDRIIKIRNPWGQKEWTKDWSDDSEKWTPELKLRLGIKSKDDGLFWMNVKDFVKEFHSICISKYIPNYLYTATKLQIEQQKELTTKKILLMRVYEPTHAFISLAQSHRRKFKIGQHKYSLFQLIIGQLDDQTNEVLHYYGSAFNNIRDIVVENQFAPGCYVLYIEVNWVQEYDRHLVISSYGSKSVQFQEMNIAQNQENKVITQIFDGLVRSHERISDQQQVVEYQPGIKATSGQIGGYIYYWYQNQTTTSLFEQKVKFFNLQNLEICPPFHSPLNVYIICRPLYNVLVKFKIMQSGDQNYNLEISRENKIMPVNSDQDIIQQSLLKPSEKNIRSIKGKEIQVIQFIKKFEAGVAIFYQNKENIIYKEEIHFEVSNLQGIEFDISQDLVVEIPAGQIKLVYLKSIDPTKTYKFHISFKSSFIDI